MNPEALWRKARHFLTPVENSPTPFFFHRPWGKPYIIFFQIVEKTLN